MLLATCLTLLAYLGCAFLLDGQKIGLSYACNCQFLPWDISLPSCMVAKLVRKVARSKQQHGKIPQEMIRMPPRSAQLTQATIPLRGDKDKF